MNYTLDRFEETFAILEADDRTMLQIPSQQLPPNAEEGCTLTLVSGRWQTCDAAETARRIREKMDNLWK